MKRWVASRELENSGLEQQDPATEIGSDESELIAKKTFFISLILGL
jgi:hypothetical protein